MRYEFGGTHVHDDGPEDSGERHVNGECDKDDEGYDEEEPGCTELECGECGAPAGEPCRPWCIADKAT
jgi:hypothetical protein